jgi:hypothetical protein
MTKDELIQYLRVCADLADAPKDGIAHVAIVPLRQAIQFLESSAEPTREHCSCSCHQQLAMPCHNCCEGPPVNRSVTPEEKS